MPRLDRSQSANVDLKHRKRMPDHSLLQSRALLGGQGKGRKRTSGYDKNNNQEKPNDQLDNLLFEVRGDLKG